ncbi:hypothetical protein [Mesorhizobium escarrei]|uniref:DUF982 domain-containing protein n=1 Tax=Mesorhizobium escarrei TaxID=666018 RepID=A0ABN8KEI4_9HYPH|nr:hypothetical protein [Mesorhizobium escarrei]CAH2408132.1 hypothetical protein MES5069_650065 [Mesorhizobium escarrei]
MQIIRTEVTQATAPTGQPILRVIFCGEGGDCVTVDMARVYGGNNEAAISRAKAALVQTATLDLAVNDYDARSNGNLTKSPSQRRKMKTAGSTPSSIATADAAVRFLRPGCQV